MLSKKSQTDPLLERVRALVEPLCAARAIDLVDVAWGSEAGQRVLRVTIERLAAQAPHADGWGVSLEDCAELSREISRDLDAHDTVPFAYTLEVSSPGLERELTGGDDFRRFVGLLAKAKLSRPAPDGQRLLRGTIVSVDGSPGGEILTMHVDKKDLAVPLAVVTQGNLVYVLQKASRTELRGEPASAAKAKAPRRAVGKSAHAPQDVDGSARDRGRSGRKANVRSES